MTDFAVYLEVQIKTGGISSSIAKGFAAATTGMKPGAAGVIKGLGTALAGRLVASVNPATRSIANKLLADVREILSRPGRGRVYTTEWRTSPQGFPYPLQKVPRAKPHQASAPGDPPAKDTGNLLFSVKYDIKASPSGPVIWIGTPVIYGLYLEFGMSKHYLPRPWLRILANAVKAGKMETRGDGYTVVLADSLRKSSAGFLNRLFIGG